MHVAGFTCGIWLAFGALAAAAPNDLDDRDITLAVESRLLVEDAVPSHRIDVSTQDGIVTLSGSVNHYYAKLLAKMATESVKGVVGVIDHIEVQSTDRLDSRIRSDVISKLMLDPVTDAFDIDVDVDDPFNAKTDREIREDIQDQLRWSPFVDSDDITVEVHSGVATLKGSVNDWNELKSARESARDGGAVAVINKLSINDASGGDE
ncbi:MAG: BON domain-containing protein [Planctomycetaceae bacterium]|nr:MAG: BON domain-containing protein [Planctomycetaceae bacterium]